MENGESSAGATITIVLLLGLIILVSSYIVYDRVYSNRDNDQKISEQPIINDNYDGGPDNRLIGNESFNLRCRGACKGSI